MLGGGGVNGALHSVTRSTFEGVVSCCCADEGLQL